jgi:predicted dithiol-disulfide oxidoreductase (DUF899 family)
MPGHRIGTRDEFDAAREKLLAEEKELTRRGDELARKRRELPWVPVEKDYRLETEDGAKALAELFEGRSQLLVYHFMYGPTYQAGCSTCSSIADSFNGLLPHLEARDVTMICVSGAPLEKLLAYRERMGWSFNWASSHASDFDREIGFSGTEEETRDWVEPMLDELPPIAARNAKETGTDLISYVAEGFGFNAFALEDGAVHQTYSTTGRGVEFLMSYYGILDRAPNGRDEGDGFQLWIQRHDEYGVSQEAAAR